MFARRPGEAVLTKPREERGYVPSSVSPAGVPNNPFARHGADNRSLPGGTVVPPRRDGRPCMQGRPALRAGTSGPAQSSLLAGRSGFACRGGRLWRWGGCPRGEKGAGPGHRPAGGCRLGRLHPFPLPRLGPPPPRALNPIRILVHLLGMAFLSPRPREPADLAARLNMTPAAGAGAPRRARGPPAAARGRRGRRPPSPPSGRGRGRRRRCR